VFVSYWTLHSPEFSWSMTFVFLFSFFLQAAALFDQQFAPEHESSAFVHLFEWSWADIAKECEEWLGPKGFTAVQVSPPTEHIQGSPWWTRYQPVTYKLVSRSGDEKAFADMVSRCKKVGVGIYVDAVINHIAGGSGVGVAGSIYGDRMSPIYNQSDMHHRRFSVYMQNQVGFGAVSFTEQDLSHNCMVENYHDKFNVQYCDLVGLPDLCTGCEKVQRQVAEYITHLSDIGITGFRVDAAKHQDTHELGQLLSRVPKHLFLFQEVIPGADEAVLPRMYFDNGHVTEFDYLRQLRTNFLADGKLSQLKSFGEQLVPSNKAVVFINNHDTQRGDAKDFTYKSGKLYELANIFMLAHPYGYPKVLSSYDFNGYDQGPPSTPVHSQAGLRCSNQATLHNASAPWVCEHRWPSIANMVGWRKAAGKKLLTNFQAPDGDTVAFCRGTSACIALNRQRHATWSARVRFELPAGRYCNIIESDDTSSCPVVDVAADGSVHLNVPPLSAVALHVNARMMQVETVFA